MRLISITLVILALLNNGLCEDVEIIKAVPGDDPTSGSDGQPTASAQHREDTSLDDGNGSSLEGDLEASPSAKHNSYSHQPNGRDKPSSLAGRGGHPPLPPPHLIHGHPIKGFPNNIGGPHHAPQQHSLAHSTGHVAVKKEIPEAAIKLYSGNEIWPSGSGDSAKIINLDVKCEKNSMKVFIAFDKPFYGIIFSKGHYNNIHCIHLPAGLGRTSATFELNLHTCGTTGNTENGLYGYGSDSGSGTYFENIIVIQYDPQVQEVWDQARKLRCTWHDQYEKSVTFRPFPVDMLDVVRADFAGDNVGCWMQVQVGKGPWAPEVSGLVKIGQTMTMVLAIKDEESKFDMLVRNCVAHDGKRAPIQLVDQRGCVTRSKLMSKFTKIKNFGASASVLSYAHFQAFKFPDSMEVHFQCTIQICRYQCPEQCSADQSAAGVLLHSNPYQESILTSHHGAIRPDAVYGPPQALPAAPLAPEHYLLGNSRRDERRVRQSQKVIHKREVNAAAGELDHRNDEEQIGVNRVIKVVSTGDLTFALDDTTPSVNGSAPTMVFPTKEFEENAAMICVSSFGFSATLVFLLSILVVSCTISAVLCAKLRRSTGEAGIWKSYLDDRHFVKKAKNVLDMNFTQGTPPIAVTNAEVPKVQSSKLYKNENGQSCFY